MKAKVFVYDLEISPILGWAYSRYDARLIHVEREPYIMCFSYKWYGQSTVHSVSLPDFKLYKTEPHNDIELVKKLWSLMDEADIVVAHNALNFDNRFANERFFVHRLGPVSPYKTVDTLRVAKKEMRGTSNSLNNLCDKLEFGTKTKETHSDLWRKCLDCDKKAWEKMVRYCKQDVILLDKLYHELVPWVKSVNIAIYGNKDGCPHCGSIHTEYRGYKYTKVGTFHQVYCKDCKGWSRERLADKEIEKPIYTV